MISETNAVLAGYASALARTDELSLDRTEGSLLA
jgi:hypothetical protein